MLKLLRGQSALQAAMPRLLPRAFATQTAPASQFDWDKFGEVVTSDEGKRQLAHLRSRYIDIQSRLQDSGKVKTPDWASYEKDVDPKLLGTLRKAFEDLKFPEYDASKDLQEVESQFGPILKQAKELAEFSAKRLKELDEEIKSIQQEKERVKVTTIDEELARDPETAKQIDKEIAEGNYLP